MSQSYGSDDCKILTIGVQSGLKFEVCTVLTLLAVTIEYVYFFIRKFDFPNDRGWSEICI